MLIYEGNIQELSIQIEQVNQMTQSIEAGTIAGEWDVICNILKEYELRLLLIAACLGKKDIDAFCKNHYLIIRLLRITDVIRDECEFPRTTEYQYDFVRARQIIIQSKPSIEKFCMFYATKYADRAMGIGISASILLLIIPGASIFTLKLTFGAVIEEAMRGAYVGYLRYKEYFSDEVTVEHVNHSAFIAQ